MSDEAFKEIVNPYIVGNPVKSKNMFFGRDEDFRRIKNTIASDGSHVILLIGGRRSGKTSILMQINNGRIKEVCEPVLCDFHDIVPKIKKDEDLPRLIGDCILKNPHFELFKSSFYAQFDNQSISYNERLQHLIISSIEKIKPKKLVLLCDEFDNLEKSFEKGDLSSNSITWVKSILSQDVFFVMTSSQALRNNYVREVFAYNSIINKINVLSEQDTYDLITRPVRNYLTYDNNSLKEIYRLSGGQPYFTQYICQILITDVNYTLKRDFILPEDLDAVIKSFIDHPPGHMIETWRYLSSPVNSPTYTPYVLSGLAATIKNKAHYADIKTILKISRKKQFIFNEKQLRESLAWLKTQDLLDWKGETYRFKFDLLRHWIVSYYETGDDVDAFIKDNISKDVEKYYIEQIQPILERAEHNKEKARIYGRELIDLSKKFHVSKSRSITLINHENKKLPVPIDDDIIDIIIDPESSIFPVIPIKKIIYNILGIFFAFILFYFIYSYFVNSCNDKSSDLNDGIECFENKKFKLSKNIFNKVIKNQQDDVSILISKLDKNEYIKPYVYLAFLAINENKESESLIKSIYFFNSDLKIEEFPNVKEKYVKIFNESKNKLKTENEKVNDIITQSNFIYICYNRCKNNRNGNGFWIGETEVSNNLWSKLSSNKSENMNEYPIQDITWSEADDFSRIVKKRLCSRSEWITALDNGKNEKYKTASVIFIETNENKRAPVSAARVESGEVGTTGVLNLIGNVSEFITEKGKPNFIGLHWEEMIFDEKNIIPKIKKEKGIMEKEASAEYIGVRLCFSY